MKQIRILTNRYSEGLENGINLFFHEMNLHNWKLIAITHFTHPATSCVYSEYEARIIYEKPDGTN